MRAFGLLALSMLLSTAPLSSSLAQSARPAEQSMDTRQQSDAMSRYYESPFDIPKFLIAWEKLGNPGPDSVMGFIAGVFTKSPDQIAPVAALTLGPTAQILVVQSLRLAGRSNEAITAARQWRWPSDQIAKITPTEPLTKRKASLPNIFDIMWGAAFATGDAAYIRPIYDYYDEVASQPNVDVRDIVAVVMAKYRSNPGMTKDVSGKYPRETFVQIVYAASALWSLDSNARQHKFVAAGLDQFKKQQPESPAAKGADEVRKARP